MKLCNTCSKTKEASDFHKRKASTDGLAARCKKCQSVYDKARANNPDRVSARANYAKSDRGIKKTLEAKARWAEKNKGKIYETTKRYRANNPNKYKAHGKIAYEIKMGSLVKEPCEICGNEKVHGHHDDYAKPLNVRWLCPFHHNEWHTENGEGKNP